jgi:hypothetical protein
LIEGVTLDSIQKLERACFAVERIDLLLVPVRDLEDVGEDEDHPDNKEDVKNHSYVEEHVKKLRMSVLVFLFFILCHNPSVHYQGG